MTLLETDPIDLLLDEKTGDIVFTDGDLSFSTGSRAVAQQIRIATSMIRGEWFLDLDEGVPYFKRDTVTDREAILGGKFNEARATAEFRRVIAAVPGVASISTIRPTFESRTRTMTVTWEVRTTFGTIESGTIEV